MKNIVFLIAFLLPHTLYSQQLPESDYFSLGIYSGSYVGNSPLVAKNDVMNSLEAEIEYNKFDFLSFHFRTLYTFTEYFPKFMDNEPETFRLLVSFGSKYYLRNKDIKPFFEASITQETNFVGEYFFVTYNSDGTANRRKSYKEFIYHYSLGLGAGSQFDITNKLSFQIKYNIYKNLSSSGYDFNGFSVLSGLKIRL